MFVPQEYTLVDIKVVSALVPKRIFFFKKSYLFQLLKKSRNRRFRSEILQFFFSYLFASLEYSLVSIKVVSALVPDQFFFPNIVI